MSMGDQWPSARACCCVGYLTNPGGRCCMDLQDEQRANTVTSDKIIIGNIEPRVIAQGWQCPLCQTVHAPHVNSCSCRKSAAPLTINTSDGTVIQTASYPTQKLELS